jgi:hypothetical protein
MALATLSIDMVAKMATFEKDLQRTVQVAENASSGMNKAFGLAKAGVAGLASALSVDFFVNYVRGAIDSIDKLNDLKDATGASIEKISALEDVALRNGNSFESMAGSLVKFNKVLNEAKPGSDMEQTLKSIGLNAKELRALDPADALVKTAQALAGYADDGNKARLIQDLFGKSIREAAPWLKDLAENGKLNATVTTQQAEEAEKFNKELAKLAKNSLDTSRAIVGHLLPAMNQLFEDYRTGGFSKAISGDFSRGMANLRNKMGIVDTTPEGSWDDPNASFDSLEAKRLAKQRKSAPAPFSKEGSGGGNARARKTAEQIAAEKELIEILKLKRIAASWAGDEVNKENTELAKWYEEEARAILRLKRAAAAAPGDQINRENEELEQLSKKVVKVEDDFASLGASFSSSLEDAIVKGGDLRSVIQGLGQDILRIGVRKSITEPLGNALSGLFGGFSFASLFGIDGSHAGGLASVPYDGYIAELHKGERVLTAQQARGGLGQTVVVNISNTVGDVASVSTVMKGMQAVRAQIVGELSRGQRFGGAMA